MINFQTTLTIQQSDQYKVAVARDLAFLELRHTNDLEKKVLINEARDKIGLLIRTSLIEMKDLGTIEKIIRRLDYHLKKTQSQK